MTLFAQAVATTTVLIAASLVSKLLLEGNEGPAGYAQELLRQALHWRDVATQDADAALRLQHATAASTLLQAARTITRDADLERATGMDVPRLARSMEAAVADARQILRPHAQVEGVHAATNAVANA